MHTRNYALHCFQINEQTLINLLLLLLLFLHFQTTRLLQTHSYQDASEQEGISDQDPKNYILSASTTICWSTGGCWDIDLPEVLYRLSRKTRNRTRELRAL